MGKLSLLLGSELVSGYLLCEVSNVFVFFNQVYVLALANSDSNQSNRLALVEQQEGGVRKGVDEGWLDLEDLRARNTLRGGSKFV